MVKRTKRGAGLMPAAIAEIRRLRAEWAELKHTDLLKSPDKEKTNTVKDINRENIEKSVLKPLNNNRQLSIKKTKLNRIKRAMSLSKPIYSDVLFGVVALVEVGNEHRALALRAALSALGASVAPNWSALVTHVVWGEGGSTVIRANARTYAARLVSPLWVEACATSNQWLPERAFPTATRDSDLPSPKTLLRLLREAEIRQVPVQVLLTEGLTPGDGESSFEPGAGDSATISAGPLPASTTKDCPKPGADGPRMAGPSKSQTSSAPNRPSSSSDQNSPTEQDLCTRPIPVDVENTRKDEEKALHEGRENVEPNDALGKADNGNRNVEQGAEIIEQSATSNPGATHVRPGTSCSRNDGPSGRGDRETVGPSQENQLELRNNAVPQDSSNVQYGAEDRLGAKPKIRPPPKEKKGKKKSSGKQKEALVSVNPPPVVSDYASDEVFYVNTLPRKALPISMSPTPPVPPLPRQRTRCASPPEEKSPSHGRRAWPPLDFFLPPIKTRDIPCTITSEDQQCRSPTPPLHGHRRCQIMPQQRRRSPKERYKSPSPGPSRAPHVPPQLRHHVSPQPRDRSPEFWSMREQSETMHRRARSPGPSRRRTKSNDRNSSPKPYFRERSGDKKGSNRRNKSPETGRSRPRSRFPFESRPQPSSRSSSSSQSPSSTTVSRQPEPMERETSFGGTQEDNGTRAPFPIPPRSSFVRRPRTNSAPNIHPDESSKPKPQVKKKGRNRRMLFLQRFFDDNQNEDPERESDPEPETNDKITWGKYWNQRAGRTDERNIPIRQLVSTGLRQLKENYRCARTLQRTLMQAASSNGSESDMEDEPVLTMRDREIPASVKQAEALGSPRHERRALARAERSARRFADRHADGSADKSDDKPADGSIERPLVLAGNPEPTRPASPILFSLRPRIVLTGMSTEERMRITEACVQLGGRIQTRVNRNTSHVLIGSFGPNGNENHITTATPVPGTNNGLVSIDMNMPRPVTVRLRTLNTLAGAVRGCRVLRAQWALDSLAADNWLPYYHYQIPYLKTLAERAAAERHAFGLSRADYAFDVFNGRRVIISVDCEQREAVTELLALCGAVLYDHEGHIIRNQETSERLNVNRSILIGHQGEQVLRSIPPQEGRNEDGSWAGSDLEHSSNVTLGTQPGQVSTRWVFDSVAAGRMRSLRQYTIPTDG